MNIDNSTQQQLEELNLLLNAAFSNAKSVPEGLNNFIDSLEASGNDFFLKLVPEIKRYSVLLSSQDLFEMIRSSIKDLWCEFCNILPKSVRVKFISRRKSVESAMRKIILNFLIGKDITLNDIFAFRIIIDSVDGEEKNIEYCEIAKNFCIQYFKNKRKCKLVCQKDYVSNPKKNGYKSIHLIFNFISSDASIFAVNPSFEIQIRTMDMDIENEFGTAKHAAFKETQYEAVKVIKINIKDITIPHFRVVVITDDSEKSVKKEVVIDNVGLVKALHVEERHKTF